MPVLPAGEQRLQARGRGDGDPPLAGQAGQGVGSGFIVRSDGIVVTNCHVVEGGTKITVSTSAKNPQSYDARVIGGDCEHDLATGLGELVQSHTKTMAAGGQMKLIKVQELARHVIQITRLYTVFEVHPDEDTAVKSFHRSAA